MAADNRCAASLVFLAAADSSVFKGLESLLNKTPKNATSIMPYIKKERRDAIVSGAEPQDAGELNFAITTMVDKYLQNKGDLRYAHLNEAVGALECAKLELYRRVAGPYEDEKIKEFGDVYRSNMGAYRSPTPAAQ
jgi:hypothetical protein